MKRVRYADCMRSWGLMRTAVRLRDRREQRRLDLEERRGLKPRMSMRHFDQRMVRFFTVRVQILGG